MNRLSWDNYFIKMAALVAERSTCNRHHMGAVVVKGKRVLTTGYNGAAKGIDDCIKLGCFKDQKNIGSGTGHEICRGIHAEQNAILQAATYGIDIDGSVLYCTHTPCGVCAKLITNVGIKSVVTYNQYVDRQAQNFLHSSGISLWFVDRPNNIISFKD